MPSTLDPLLRPFESVLNRNVSASTPARELVKQLDGRSFAIQAGVAPGPTIRIRLAAHATGVRVTGGDEPADAAVSGSPFALLALVRGGAQKSLQGSGVAITGDADVAKGFEQLLQHARPDLEEELARVIGDGPAYHAARVARGVLQWGRQAADSLARNVGEYLQEEGRDVPARAELEHFLDAVDHLRDDVDRADARLKLLEARALRNR
jgi:ubiquinone biosynthesis protein UbiJ